MITDGSSIHTRQVAARKLTASPKKQLTSDQFTARIKNCIIELSKICETEIPRLPRPLTKVQHDLPSELNLPLAIHELSNLKPKDPSFFELIVNISKKTNALHLQIITDHLLKIMELAELFLKNKNL